MKPTINFSKDNFFIAKTFYKDESNIVFYVPSIYVEPWRDYGYSVKIKKLVFVFLKFRFCIEYGYYKEFKKTEMLTSKIDKDYPGIGEFWQFTSLKYGPKWKLDDILGVINSNSYLVTIIINTNINFHYTKMLIIQEMFNKDRKEKNNNGEASWVDFLDDN